MNTSICILTKYKIALQVLETLLRISFICLNLCFLDIVVCTNNYVKIIMVHVFIETRAMFIVPLTYNTM